MDFLLLLIELFPLGFMTEALRTIIGAKSANLLQRGQLSHNFRYK